MASAMRRVSFRNLRAHKVRLLMTVIAVVLGTAFVSGSFVFTDTLSGTFNSIFSNSLKGVDTQVKPISDRNVGVPISLTKQIQGVDGVRSVQEEISGDALLIGSNGKVVRGGGAPSVGGSWTPADQSIDVPPTITSGTAPTQNNQVVINESAAKKAHLVAGDQAKVLVPTTGVINVTVTGIYHTKTAVGGYVGILFPQAQGVTLFTDGQHVPSILVAAK